MHVTRQPALRPSARLSTVLLAVAASGLMSALAPAAARAQQRWTPLARGIGADVDIDTTSAIRAGGTVTAWLRFLLGPEELEYQLERTQVDCQAGRSRILERRTAPTERGQVSLGNAVSKPPAPDSQWTAFAAGSLGAEVIKGVCGRMRIS